ncbi:MAG TPA: hypothetical protein VED16_00250 [Candidatus Acidoferrum sp.]|nr:hypothetical protein [Candidatus Acidoferrum sp.]
MLTLIPVIGTLCGLIPAGLGAFLLTQGHLLPGAVLLAIAF